MVLVKTLRVGVHDPQLDIIIEAAPVDSSYQTIIEAVTSKWLEIATTTSSLYCNQWDFLAYEKDAKKAIFKSLHIQHMGHTKTYLNACQLYFWPWMRNDVKHMVSNCLECLAYLPSKSLPPLTQTKASRPFEIISIDLLSHFWRTSLPHLCWSLQRMAKWNYDFGKPERFRTDCGPQFRSEFIQWCEDNSIIHELSRPDHHQSKGYAENAS